MEKREILNRYTGPIDIKYMNYEELERLAEEVRDYMLEVTSKNGGHIGASLGTVELTIAILRVFDPPKDTIIWDIGHQAYAWKILTDRKEEFKTLRKYKGISGFLRRDESIYDAFGAGHSSTSVSAGLGFRIGKDLKGEEGWVVAIIGDGAMTAGMAFEALNNAGHLRPDKFIVILNDNEMSISPNVGAISNYLGNIMSGRFVQETRQKIKRILGYLGEKPLRVAKLTEEFIKGLISPGIIFEELGFNYIGVVDGHNIESLEKTLKNAKYIKGPVLIHVITKKGKGYKPAEDDPVKWHGVPPYKRESGEVIKKKGTPTWTSVFSKSIVELGEMYEDLVCITPAMKEGSGLSEFAERFPERFFDVGIAEQHAATFAAGLSAEGLRVVLAYYSTFMQRAYDQIIHDIALQNLPVTFAVDRAGLVGDDGPTHHGTFDLSFLRCIPNIIISAPKDEQELRNLLYTSVKNRLLMSIRYPRGSAPGNPFNGFEEIKIGTWEKLIEGSYVAILAIGQTVYPALESAERLIKEEGITPTVVNARFVKPLDEYMLTEIFENHDIIVTVEDNTVIGGFGSAVLEFASQKGILKRIINMGIPDRFIEHGPQDVLRKEVGIDADSIYKKVVSHIYNKREPL